jgi:hypothetical protein
LKNAKNLTDDTFQMVLSHAESELQVAIEIETLHELKNEKIYISDSFMSACRKHFPFGYRNASSCIRINFAR